MYRNMPVLIKASTRRHTKRLCRDSLSTYWIEKCLIRGCREQDRQWACWTVLTTWHLSDSWRLRVHRSYVELPVFLFGCNQICIFLDRITEFNETHEYQILRKSIDCGLSSCTWTEQAVGRTHVTKVVVAFCAHANAPKRNISCVQYIFLPMLAGKVDLSFLQNGQTDPKAHPAFFTLSAGVLS